jgi:RHS repeat-associated protein
MSGSSPGGGGLTIATVEPEVVGLELRDAPVGYAPPVGPTVFFNLVYSHRDTQQPTSFSYTNFGPKWTFDWLSYITDSVSSSASALLYRRGGGNEPFTFSSTSGTSAYPGPYSQATLTRTVNGSGATTGFTMTYPDGTFEQFNQALGNQFFMTAEGDKAGNKITLTYDSQMRIVAITDAIGQVSTLTYGLSGSPLVVTKITDPFGRSASFTYNSSGSLSSITDVLGITSSYTYGQGSDPDFINTLTTPYGSTTFTYGDSTTNSNLGSTRFLKTVDPLGRASYVEYDEGVDAGDTSGGVMKDSTQIPAGMNTCDQYLNYRNTFIFDANQYALAQGATPNYSQAKVIHWLHTSDETSASRVMESQKQPLENRVWYNYAGQPTGSCDSILFGVSSAGTVTNGASSKPITIGRVLDNGTTQLKTFQYNTSGNLTQSTDPVGRHITYTYAANGIDLVTVANTTNGTQTLETGTYNSQHLPLTITGANGTTAHFQYNAAGQLMRYTDPLGHVTTRTYDSSGRVKTIQGAIAGALYTLAYDSVSRVAAVTDPAGSTVHYTYDAADRPTTATFPDGTINQRTYTLLDLATSTDRLGQTIQYTRDADRELVKTTDPLGQSTTLGYNLAGRIASITDPNGHTTTMGLDAQSRVISKQYADGSTAYTDYQVTTSLPALITDALGQTTTYTYNVDNSRATIGYNAIQPTAAVSFQYDPAYLRVVSMTDGVGTTTYSYYPVTSGQSLGANQLQAVTSPIAGASASDTVSYSYDALNRVVGVAIDGVNQSIGYDAIDRVTTHSTALDTFLYSYSDATSRVTGISSTQGPAFALSYYGPTGDELLQQITATTQSGGALNQFGYVYNSNDLVTSSSVSSPASQSTTYLYDKANRVTSASGSTVDTYGYDAASNISSITTGGARQSLSYTSTNVITSGTYDANGSPLSLSGVTFAWDGANRLANLSGASGKSSTFTYDGLGNLVRVVDSLNGTVTADHSYFWCGPVRCLAHDNTQSGSPVSTQYFAEGVISGGEPLYYVADKLGSVSQLVSNSGAVAAQYTYDPYGNQTQVGGTLVADIGYAGYFNHAASGLAFAQFRAYDPTHARWLNRDPIGEAGGINLYEYADDDPLNITDPRGYFGVFGWVVIGIVAVVAGLIVYSMYKCAQACGEGHNCPYAPNSGDPETEYNRNAWILQCKTQCEKAYGETSKVGPW